MSLFATLSPAWQSALSDVAEEINKIDSVLKNSGTFNPKYENIFRALGQSPVEFRVIIVGQDPYPDSDLAMGLAFSIPEQSTKIPPTLKNIKREFEDEYGITMPSDLTPWLKSGVLLLNRILTCETGKSLSHLNFGWESITTQIVREVVKVNPNVVAILWGKNAHELTQEFKVGQLISTSHPSPLSAFRGFLGSKPFSTANQLLRDSNQVPVNWA
jgi:uracil-DNA glycosylase